MLILWLVGCGGEQRVVEDYCQEAYILAQLWTEDMDEEAYEDCVLGVQEDLDTLEKTEREQVMTCIRCISDTPEEECGCCTIDGELEILDSDCESDCDTDAYQAFCEL